MVKLLGLACCRSGARVCELSYEIQVRELLREAAEDLRRIREYADNRRVPPTFIVTRAMGSVEMARAGFDELHPEDGDTQTDPRDGETKVFRVPK